MNKKGIFAIGAGAAGLIFGIYKFVKKIYSGSKYLNCFLDKVEELKPDSTVELDEDGYYSVIKNSNKPIKVLQITDMHVGGGYLSRHEDMQAISIMYRTIKATKPDLVVLTGDIAYARAHVAMSRNNLNSFRIVTDVLEKTKIPYAFTFGNHDCDGHSMYKRREVAKYLMNRNNCLMVENDDTDGITGFSNYYVKIKNNDGKLNSLIFLLDSNEYIISDKKKNYDYIHKDQVDWYEKVTKKINEEEGRNIPSHIFFHIPIKEYEEAWNSVTKAEKGAVYCYGSKNEGISTSKVDSLLFEKILELGSTKAVYCGHDHLNDFSVEYKGVRFTYGQSIDCLLYTKNLSEHKGATLIRINNDGSFSIKGKKHR